MGLFDIFKKGYSKNNKYKRVEGLNWQPTFYSAGVYTKAFETDVVQQAIRCITQEMKKLEPRHVQRKDNGYRVINDNIQSVLDNPNALMVTADFIEKVVYNLLTTSNSYVLPVWENGFLTALYPLQPVNVEFLQDTSNSLFVKMSFSNGYESTVKYTDLIHIRNNFGANEFLGGNAQGEIDSKALQKVTELNEILLDGVQKSIKSSYAVNGILKINTMMDEGKTEAALADLTQKLNNNENGFMTMDLKGEFVPFNKDVKVVDESTLKFVDEKLLRFFGVSVAILTGDYTPEQYSSFYQKTIEPLVISMSQAFTKAIFTKRESASFGHKIIFYHDKLDFVSINDKKEIGALLSSTGACSIDELRSIFGMSPCEDENLGKTMIMSKNYGSAESVKDQVSVEADATKKEQENQEV